MITQVGHFYRVKTQHRVIIDFKGSLSAAIIPEIFEGQVSEKEPPSPVDYPNYLTYSIPSNILPIANSIIAPVSIQTSIKLAKKSSLWEGRYRLKIWKGTVDFKK